MTDKVQNSKSASPGERLWTRRLHCLAAALGRTPVLPEGLKVQATHPALLERAFQLVLQYNETPEAFDLTKGFRPHTVLQQLKASQPRAFHKLLGSFAQRYGFAPDRTLQLAGLVTGMLPAFQATSDWILTSDGVSLHVVMTGTSQGHPIDAGALLAAIKPSCAFGLAVHEGRDASLQIGLTLLLDAPADAQGCAFLLHVVSPALSALRTLPEVS